MTSPSAATCSMRSRPCWIARAAPDEAATALRDAIALYERKGNVVAAARARGMLEHPVYEAGVTER